MLELSKRRITSSNEYDCEIKNSKNRRCILPNIEEFDGTLNVSFRILRRNLAKYRITEKVVWTVNGKIWRTSTRSRIKVNLAKHRRNDSRRIKVNRDGALLHRTVREDTSYAKRTRSHATCAHECVMPADSDFHPQRPPLSTARWGSHDSPLIPLIIGPDNARCHNRQTMARGRLKNQRITRVLHGP